MLLNVIKFLDDICIEKHLYWMLPTINDADTLYELEWRKSQTFPWRCRVRGAEFWQQLTNENLEVVLISLGIDVDELALDFQRTILQHAVYADMIYHKVCKFIGKDKVEQAIDENKRFLDQLVEVVKKITAESERKNSDKIHDGFNLVSSGGLTASSRSSSAKREAAHLKLLRHKDHSPSSP
jgi:hypothetical protein